MKILALFPAFSSRKAKDVKQAGTRLPISRLIYIHLQHKKLAILKAVGGGGGGGGDKPLKEALEMEGNQ